MYKNSKKIDELKAEFEKLQQSEDCEFAPDIDGFIDFLAEEIIRLEEEVDWRVRLWRGAKRRVGDGFGADEEKLRYEEFKRERNRERWVMEGRVATKNKN